MKKRRYWIGIACAVLSLLSRASVLAANSDGASAVDLQKIHVADSDNWEISENPITDTYGNEYRSNILYFDSAYDGYVKYDLNGEYTSLSGTFVASQDTGSDANMDVGIWADGILVFSKSGITRQSKGEDFQLDVTGVGTLEIKTMETDQGNYGKVFLVNGKIEKNTEKVLYPERSSLEDLVVVDEKNYEYENAINVDTYGGLHKGVHMYSPYEDYKAYAVYNLNKEFQTFDGVVTAGEKTDAEIHSTIVIWMDDQIVYQQEGIAKQTEPTAVHIDVTNAMTLKVEVGIQEKGWYHSKVFLTDTVLKKHEHTAGEWEITKEATCTEAGAKVMYCTECGEECLSEEIPATGHTSDEKEVVEKEATCTEAGTKVMHCKTCGEVCSSEDIPATGHTPDGKDVVEKEATCEETGVTVQHCSVCGEACEEKEIPLADHQPEDKRVVDVEATCTAEGEQSLHCKVCGEVLKTEAIPKINHQPSEEPRIITYATCTQQGSQETYCKYCGESLSVEAIPATGHSFGSWTTVSGSVWNGPIEKERVCATCFQKEQKNVSTWMWVKPVVIILVLLAAIYFVLKSMLAKKGLKMSKENVQQLLKSLPDSTKSVKKNQNPNNQNDDDIFNK